MAFRFRPVFEVGSGLHCLFAIFIHSHKIYPFILNYPLVCCHQSVEGMVNEMCNNLQEMVYALFSDKKVKNNSLDYNGINQ